MEMPATEIISHGMTALAPAVSQLNVGGSLEKSSHVSAVHRFTAPGERVIGLQFQRLLRFNAFSRKDLVQARLENPKWALSLEGEKDWARHRGGPGGLEGDEVEIKLEDDLHGLEIDQEAFRTSQRKTALL
jgi:hypothetical protein